MVGNGELHACYSQAMKFIEINIQNSASDEENSSLILKDFHINNYHTTKNFLRLCQVRNVNNLLREANNYHLHYFVRTF